MNLRIVAALAAVSGIFVVACSEGPEPTTRSEGEAVTADRAAACVSKVDGPCGGFTTHPCRCAKDLVCVPNRIPDIPGHCEAPNCCPVGWTMYACTEENGSSGMNCHNPALACASSLTCGGGCDFEVTGACPASDAGPDASADAAVEACIPLTLAQACGSMTCGTAPDGCGGTIACGTCTAGEPCTVPSCLGGTAGLCACVPLTAAQACGSNTCGTAFDGCGCTVSCGTCASPQTCQIPDGATAGTCG
jgi:hypothetical protein